jgi:hypothetical protein
MDPDSDFTLYNPTVSETLNFGGILNSRCI